MKFVCLKLYMYEPFIVNFVQSLLPARPCYSCKAPLWSEVNFLRIFVDTAWKNEVIDQHSLAHKVSEAVLNCSRQEEPAILILASNCLDFQEWTECTECSLIIQSLIIWSALFWLSVALNICRAQQWRKTFWPSIIVACTP